MENTRLRMVPLRMMRQEEGRSLVCQLSLIWKNLPKENGLMFTVIYSMCFGAHGSTCTMEVTKNCRETRRAFCLSMHIAILEAIIGPHLCGRLLDYSLTSPQAYALFPLQASQFIIYIHLPDHPTPPSL